MTCMRIHPLLIGTVDAHADDVCWMNAGPNISAEGAGSCEDAAAAREQQLQKSAGPDGWGLPTHAWGQSTYRGS